jgi:Domain found in Dishevelled, Egl-10, and Pleckstrin (DEP)
MGVQRFLLATRDEALQRVWHIAFATQRIPLLTTPALDTLDLEIVAGLGDAREAVVLIDLAYLGERGMMLHQWIESLRKHYRNCEVIALSAHGAHVTAGQVQWAIKCGATTLLPRAHLVEMPSMMRQFCQFTDKPYTDIDRATAEAVLHETGFTEAEASRELEYNQLVNRVLEKNRVSLPDLVQELDGPNGLAHRDRKYHLKNYRSCMVASELVTWLAKRLEISRQDAVKTGQVMQRHGLIYHVVYEQNFDNKKLYFRAAHYAQKIDDIFIQVVLQKLLQNKHGLVTDRSYNGKSYQHCFIGQAFTDWLVKQHRFSIENAIDIGRQLFELGAFQHVVNEHPFIDGYYYYVLTGNPTAR